LADFKVFLREAHQRGLRVITELVLNHTSDQHPWFQRARRAPPAANWRDYYVWNDSGKISRHAHHLQRHRGFQLDLGCRGQRVLLAPLFFTSAGFEFRQSRRPRGNDQGFGFWFDLGVDGVRLDAVPYLYEREGTSCENLPETHAFLKKLRRTWMRNTATACCWPRPINGRRRRAIFRRGKGDECHMAFHFPLMPRLFMSLRMEDRVPIVDILQQTPPFPRPRNGPCFCATTTNSRSKW
jgi:maltose alpha-D-glucosyltransferase/alpha-amylase